MIIRGGRSFRHIADRTPDALSAFQPACQIHPFGLGRAPVHERLRRDHDILHKRNASGSQSQ